MTSTLVADHLVSGVPLVEALRATLASLEQRDWTFDRYDSCTCGHIYFGATGRAGTDRAILDLDGLAAPSYRQLLAYVAEANGLPVVPGADADGISRQAQAISDWTHRLADSSAAGPRLAAVSPRVRDERLRETAVDLVRTALLAAEVAAEHAMCSAAPHASRELAGAVA